MNVLSLFGGGESGKLALENAGVTIINYFSSEVDKYAIQIANKNHKHITHLGDIQGWREWELPKIDLVIGGSPCQGFSKAGYKANLGDIRSRLFYEYLNIINHLKAQNKDLLFFLENVVMESQPKNEITQLLGVEPVRANSKYTSAQSRDRLYWFNWDSSIPKDLGLTLADIVDLNSTRELRPCITREYKKSATCHHIANATDINGNESIKRVYATSGKSPTLTTMQGGHREPKVYAGNNFYTKLSIHEMEQLQNLPIDYTAGVSNTQRKKIIGNGWDVGMVSHFFKSITQHNINNKR